MKKEITQLIKKYNITTKHLAEVAGIRRATLHRALFDFPESEFKKETYVKLFEALYLIAKKRKEQAYELDDALDRMDEELFSHISKKYIGQ